MCKRLFYVLDIHAFFELELILMMCVLSKIQHKKPRWKQNISGGSMSWERLLV